MRRIPSYVLNEEATPILFVFPATPARRMVVARTVDDPRVGVALCTDLPKPGWELPVFQSGCHTYLFSRCFELTWPIAFAGVRSLSK